MSPPIGFLDDIAADVMLGLRPAHPRLHPIGYRFGQGYWLGAFGGGSGTPVPPDVPVNITPPTITGTVAAIGWGQGLWDDGSPVSAELFGDGVSVDTFTAPSDTYVGTEGVIYTLIETATGPGGSETTTSDAVIFEVGNTILFTSNWDGTPPPLGATGQDASLAELPVWDTVQADGTVIPKGNVWYPHLSVLDNAGAGGRDIYIAGSTTIQSNIYRYSTGSTAHRFRFTYDYNAAGSLAESVREFAVKATNGNNLGKLSIQNNAWGFVRRVGAVNTTIIPSQSGAVANGTEFTLDVVTIGDNSYVNVTVGSTRSLSFAQNGGLGYMFATTGNLLTGTYVGMGGAPQAVYPQIGNRFMEISTPPANRIVLIAGTSFRSPDDPDKVRIPFTGTYWGTVDNIEVGFIYEGVQVYAWTAGAALSGGLINDHIDVSGILSGGDGLLTARDPSDPTTAGSATAALVSLPMIQGVMGANFGYDWPSTTADAYDDTGTALSWKTWASGMAINDRSTYASSSSVATSATGTGLTFKSDFDGTLYKDNGLGETAVRLTARSIYARAGTYQIFLVPGLTVTLGAAPSTWAYDTLTGILTYAVPTAGVSYSLSWKIELDSGYPSSGIPQPRSKLATDPALTPGELNLNSVVAASLPAHASVARFMTDIFTNNWDNAAGGRTSTALPVDTPANYATKGGVDPAARAIAVAKAGVDPYIAFPHTIGDGLVLDWAQRMAAAFPIGRRLYIEHSNEDWNFPRQQLDNRLEGARRGYCAPGLTAHPGTPLTIIDGSYDGGGATRIVNRTTRVVTGSFPIGTYLYADINAVGLQVYEATATTTTGQALPAGNVEGTALNNWTIKYNNLSTLLAQLRYKGRRSKEIKAIVQAEFEAVGKLAPILVIAWQGALHFSDLQPALDFDDVKLVTDRVAGGFYVGGGVAGYDLSRYTSTTDDGWTEASRDLIYDGDYAGYLASFIPRMQTAANAVVAHVETNWVLPVAAYSKAAKGTSTGIKVLSYEIGNHANQQGYPDQCAAWSAGSWTAGSFAVGSDNQTYRAISTNSVNPVGNPAQWVLFVDGNSDTWDAAKTALHRNATPRTIEQGCTYVYRSADYATFMAGFYQDLADIGLCEIIDFQRTASGLYNTATTFAAGYGGTNGVDPWRMLMGEIDTTSNEYYDAMVALKAGF